MSEVTAQEVAEVLQRVAACEIRASTRECHAWDRLDQGAWELEAEGYRIALFKQGGRFDHVGYAIAPDGRVGEVSAWHDPGNPRDLLTSDERLMLSCVVLLLGRGAVE